VCRIEKYLGEISSFDLDRVGLDELFRASDHIDCIVHAATSYGRKNEDIPEILETNVGFPVRLLEAGARHGVETVINTDTVLDRRLSAYSLSKSQFVDWLKVFSERFRVINLRFDHMYGPKDDETKFVSFVIKKCLENQDTLELTRGEQERDFIYISDLVNAYLQMIESTEDVGSGFVQFEVGTGRPLAVKDMVLKIKEITGNISTELLFGALPYRDKETMRSLLDISAVKKLGWQPVISLEEGLRRTVAELKARSCV